MKKIIYSLVIAGLFISCGDNSNRVNINEITYSDGFALHNGDKFTGTVVQLGDRSDRDKAQVLTFYKDGISYGFERHSTLDTLLIDFKMENGAVYKISELLSWKVDSDSSITYYRNGKINGKCAVIWEDGNYYYNGFDQSFNEDGKLDREVLYDKGKIISTKYFDENGKEIKE
jgi:hypothetical protein